MRTRNLVVAVVTVAALAAAAYAALSGPGGPPLDPEAQRCKEEIARAYRLIRAASAPDSVRPDYCESEARAREAVDKLRSAQALCRRYLGEDNMMISDTAIVRAERMGRKFTKKCAGNPG